MPINKIPVGKKRGGLFQVALAPAEPCSQDCFIVWVHPQQWQMPTAWTGQSWSPPVAGDLFLSNCRSEVVTCLGQCCGTASWVKSIFGILCVHRRWGHLMYLAFPVYCHQCNTMGQAVLNMKGYPEYSQGLVWLNGHCQKVGCRHVPLHHSQILGAVLCARSRAGAFTPRSDAGTAAYGLWAWRFWLLSNCIIGLSQKDTPSV